MPRDDRAVDDGAVAQARDPRLAVERGLDLAPIDLLDAIELVLLDSPSFASKRSAPSVASSADWPRIAEPLCAIERWNSPRADGIAMTVVVLPPPPDWPKIVTRSGSPPKLSMLSCTHCKRRDQVLHADVRRACPLLAAEAGQVQVAEDVEPVIDGDDDDVLLLREIRAVVEQVVAGAGREAAAVHPHHDGARSVVEARREDVDGEAVLALRRLAIQRRDDGRRLFAVRDPSARPR